MEYLLYDIIINSIKVYFCRIVSNRIGFSPFNLSKHLDKKNKKVLVVVDVAYFKKNDLGFLYTSVPIIFSLSFLLTGFPD